MIFASYNCRPLLRALACLLLGLAGLAGGGPASAGDKTSNKPPYVYYLTGSAADAVPAQPPGAPASVLMGGGPDVDEAFAWMIGKAGGGDFVVIRASGADGYNQYLYNMGGLDSVETLVVPSREAANDPFVVDRIDRAEAVFIAGGDQADYINEWKGTALDRALRQLVARNAPLGGTSAGLAVLGEFDFAALNDTITSATALENPYNRRVTLDRDFLALPGLAGAITDAHLDTRDRMGRLLTFVARLVQDGWASTDTVRAIGVDVETALLVDNGVARRVGAGSAYFLRPLIAPTVCAPKQPLTFRNVSVQRLSGAGWFQLDRWQSPDNAVASYDLSAEAGVLISSQPGGSIY